MPIVPSVTATQSLAYNNLITLSDSSSGSDGTLTMRRVYIRTATNTYLTNGQGVSTTPAYTEWPYADATILLDVLTEATSPEITVEWYAGATLKYEFTDEFGFDLQDYVFGLGLLADQTSSPGVIQDTNYYSNFGQFIVNLTCSEWAVLYGGDIYSAQNALNKNTGFIQDESFYF